MRKIVIGNWKMSPDTLPEAKKLFSGVKRRIVGLKRTRVVMCPPFVYLSEFASSSKKGDAFLGAQDVFWNESGSYTGEVSADQLSALGVSYVLVGHSERRALGETSEEVSRKVRVVLSSGMNAVLCIGERGRDEGARYLDFLKEEIKESLKGVSKNLLTGLIVAYEPIWAIGKDAEDAMNPHELHRMSLFIKKILVKIYGRENAFKVPIIYGGSVEEENAEELMRDGNVDGFLVGHESLDSKAFFEIVKIVENTK